MDARAIALGLLPVPLARKWVGGRPAAGRAAASRPAQLLVDVSVVVRHDAGTGIQRVVRALLAQLLAAPPAGFLVRPVFARRRGEYRYAPDPSDWGRTGIGGDPVEVQAGDVFLGLDYATDTLRRRAGQLAGWKRRGVSIHVVVYDLLPLRRPDWFTPPAARNHRRWLRTVAALADSAICISRSVADDLGLWLQSDCGLGRGDLPIGTIPLGSDLEASLPSRGLPGDFERLMADLSARPLVLMVGTIEPRKGYGQALAAFEGLWRQGREVGLAIVGRPGWRTEELQRRLRDHPERGRRLFWFDDASDEFLEHLYRAAAGVLVASEGEGFGLPLVEALRHGKPVLARDLPVFREVARNNCEFFSDAGPGTIMVEIDGWLERMARGQVAVPAGSGLVSWRESAAALLTCLGVAEQRCSGVGSRTALPAGGG